MANRFFSFLNGFVSGTVAKSSEVNSQFQQLEVAFDDTQTEINSAIKVPVSEGATNFVMTENPAARTNRLLQFNATGFPEAATALRMDLSAGGFKVTNLATATSGGDAVNLTKMQDYVGGVGGVPTIVGAANPSVLITDGATISWGAGTTYLVPSFPATNGAGQYDDGRSIIYSGGSTRWLYTNDNVLVDPDGALGDLAWSTQLEVVSTVEGTFFRNPAAGLAAATFDHQLQPDFYIPAVSGAWCFVVSCTTTSATAGTISLLVKYYDAGKVLISESATTDVPITAALIRLRINAATMPGGTAYISPVIRFTGVTAAAGATALHFRSPKVERGQQATANNNAASINYLLKGKALTYFGRGQNDPTVVIGSSGTDNSYIAFHGCAGSGTQYDGYLVVNGGTNGTNYRGDMTVRAKSFKSFGPIGYVSEYDNGNSGAAVTIDFMAADRGPKQKLTLSALAPAITISTAGMIVGQYQLKVVQDPAVARIVSWVGFNAADCIGGVAPVITTTLSGITFVYFYWDGVKLWVSSADWN